MKKYSRFLIFFHLIFRFEQLFLVISEPISKIFAIISESFTKIRHKFSKSDRLLESLGYKSSDTFSHFYLDDLSKFVEYIENDSKIISYAEFEIKLKEDFAPVRKVFVFFSQVKNEKENTGLNLLRSLHLILLSFLNKFGHKHQKTNKKKIKKLVQIEYSGFEIKTDYLKFIDKHKLLKETNTVNKYML